MGLYPQLRERFVEVARTAVLGELPDIESYHWPARSMRALADAGLMGLTVPQRYGGLEAGLTGLAIAGEELGRVSPSASLCFCMHAVGAGVIAAKATDDQAARYLVPIAEGRHVTTLALSEPETGIHFYEPVTRLEPDGDHFLATGTKTFVTNGGQADSYVISTLSGTAPAGAGLFDCLVLDHGAPGARWQGEWRGLGMRGNSSIQLSLEGARVPAANLLGEPGDQTWYIFQVIAPYFLTAMAATYVGLAQSALSIATDHLKERRHANTGRSLAHVPALQTKLAGMWGQVQQARLLLFQAAERGDLGAPDALPYILYAKAVAGEAAVDVANEAMTCVGGHGYRDDGPLWGLLRDARAAHVMSPTTDLLKTWTARALLDLPIL
ncbi:MAG: acyl-CoA dehydrogenase family protein [Candidatus Sericytochromatia bacterium]